jgi:hypothetical protein
MLRYSITWIVLGLSLATQGCGEGSAVAVPATTDKSPVATADGTHFLLAEEPEGAVGVIAAREQGVDDEPIVVVGRVGGQANPWIEGRAAFMLLDPSMMVVSEGEATGEGVLCTGDCCAAERANCTTMVKFVDENGRPLGVDSRKLLGIQESDLLVVRGKAKRDEHGNFAVIADGVYIRR